MLVPLDGFVVEYSYVDGVPPGVPWIAASVGIASAPIDVAIKTITIVAIAFATNLGFCIFIFSLVYSQSFEKLCKSYVLDAFSIYNLCKEPILESATTSKINTIMLK